MRPAPPSRASTAGWWARLYALVRLSCPQWYAVSITPFVAGYLAASGPRDRRLLLGLLGMWLFSVTTDLANRLADRHEDAIDYPLRARLGDLVGWGVVRTALVAVVASYLALEALFLARLSLGLETHLYWALGLFGALSYSYGLRTKARRLLGPLHYGAVSAFGLYLGWLHAGGGAGAGAPAFVLWAFGSSMLGWKDIDNLAGDGAIGYRSIYLDIVAGPGSTATARRLISVPYVLLAAFVAAGWRPLTDLWLLTLWLLGALFASSLTRAQTPSERRGVRELGILYWQLFMSAVLVASWPSAAMVVLQIASSLWWVAASRWLNCDPPGLTREHARAVVGLFQPSVPSVQAPAPGETPRAREEA